MLFDLVNPNFQPFKTTEEVTIKFNLASFKGSIQEASPKPFPKSGPGNPDSLSQEYPVIKFVSYVYDQGPNNDILLSFNPDSEQGT